MTTLNFSYVSYVILVLIALFVLNKIRVRLTLSRAKHPSLRGHAKWSRIIAKQIPFFSYSEDQIFNVDSAPTRIVGSRHQAFFKLSKVISASEDKGADKDHSSISDVNFTNAYRVPYPFRPLIERHIHLSNEVEETSGVKIKDTKGNWYHDLSGSYGVNLFGYDFYKECMKSGLEKMEKLGPVLGSYHPVINKNVEKLKLISGLDEVSFHMSGTEAVMQAVRLARYHTGKTHLVRFCGAYHGWWDGVQPGIGNQRKTNDVYTLADLSEKTLRVLSSRNDIACILINPLQALHPNSDAPSDASLINSTRKASFNFKEYSEWLQKLREVCTERGIVMIMDEVFTGFRLSYRGAQGYFSIQADIVTYGKSLGGGMPIGVVCGKSKLMKRYKDNQPVNVSFARGTFNSHPLVMTCMDEFLTRIESPEILQSYNNQEQLWNQRIEKLNQSLNDSELPIKVKNMMSVLTVNYTLPSAYNWMFQFYLRDENLMLSWIGSGRFIMSHNYDEQTFDEVIEKIVAAAIKMKAAGWWHQSPALTDKSITRTILKHTLRERFPWMKSFIKLNNINTSSELNSCHE